MAPVSVDFDAHARSISEGADLSAYETSSIRSGSFKEGNVEGGMLLRIVRTTPGDFSGRIVIGRDLTEIDPA